MNTLIKKPVISEKSFREAANSKYTFVVDKGASKDQIKSAIEKILKVNVVSVNTFNLKGKKKKTKGVLGNRSDVKKALITLDKKTKIDFFETEKEQATSKKKEEKKISKKKEDKEGKKEEKKDVSVTVKKSK